MTRNEARQMAQEIGRQRTGTIARALPPGSMDDAEYGWVVAEYNPSTQWSPGVRTVSVTSDACLEPGDMCMWSQYRITTADFTAIWKES
jgi:hypothetical protein